MCIFKLFFFQLSSLDVAQTKVAVDMDLKQVPYSLTLALADQKN